MKVICVREPAPEAYIRMGYEICPISVGSIYTVVDIRQFPGYMVDFYVLDEVRAIPIIYISSEYFFPLSEDDGKDEEVEELEEMEVLSVYRY